MYSVEEILSTEDGMQTKDGTLKPGYRPGARAPFTPMKAAQRRMKPEKAYNYCVVRL